ncbi:hypothetical protein L211DRAFT_637208 [Terfezia boudieri ATCC MYA-4762]|uniref:Extracellular membrane protein CFEM domain-containing protein n=1 Tax=Terfezia boudieri ATCC MYA-4762 TaxID=1051890 RepID=A0A3N4LC89_9PEZI|nr:hypothetical protein L211DRAFT_637208 [Terfezia boudieri ATCC MYA-4762]
MRLYLEIPLFLLPAFLLTSEVLVASATVETRRINHKNSRSSDSPEKYNLTLCAKQCRTEFFQYCHTRQPGAKGDSNVFRTCMCIYKSGAQYMDHCARHCDEEVSFPEQMGELRAWWSNWCEKHEPTSTTSISIPGPSGSGTDLDKSKIPGMSLIGDDGKSGVPTIPSPKPKTTPESEQKGQGISVITAGASVTFASAFLFLSYVMFMRRNKYARRRGILAWVCLKLFERGYRGGGAGLPRSRTTAMRMRVTNGRTEVVGNPKWLNKTMPPLPQPRSTNTERSRDVQDSGHDTAHPRTKSRFLSRIIMGRQEQKTLSGGLRRGGVLGRNQVRSKSHRHSQGGLNAVQGYADDVEEEDEKLQDYSRSKGIARSGEHATVISTVNRNEAASDRNKSLKGLLEGKEKLHGEGGLVVEEDDEVVEAAEAGSQQQHLQAVNEDEEYIQKLIALTSRNAQSQYDTNKENYDEDEAGNERAEWGYSPVSPEEDYTTISATPQLDGREWDSLTGAEGPQLNATWGLRRSTRNIGGSYGNGGLKFEEVDLVEPEYEGTGYYWTARSEIHSLQFPPNSETANSTTQGSSGYGPILPVFKSDPQHEKKSTENTNRQQHRKTRSKWRISGKIPKELLGWRGKRSGESGSTDLGRGTYEYL